VAERCPHGFLPPLCHLCHKSEAQARRAQNLKLRRAQDAKRRAKTGRRPRHPSWVDMTGKRIGRLVVLEEATSETGTAMWRCLCDCGEEFLVPGPRLRWREKTQEHAVQPYSCPACRPKGRAS
jgi:hypothetical protein